MVRVPGWAMLRQMRSASATSLPASRIKPISRRDFSSGGCWIFRSTHHLYFSAFSIAW
jgi:hypothetical protein